MIVAHGNSGKYLNSYWWGQYYSNVYLSRDAGMLLWNVAWNVFTQSDRVHLD